MAGIGHPTLIPVKRGRGDIVYPAAIPFVAVHLCCLAAFWSGVTWQALAIGFALYWLRIFGIGAGYHRYFSHRSFKTSRPVQFGLAFLAQSSAQSSVLWWAAKHRHHHLHSDTEDDVHSPLHAGYFYSHVGWVFDRRNSGTDMVRVDDLAKYPELMLLHRFEYVPAVVLATACYGLAGWSGVVVGFLWSTVAVYHATFSINSLAHVRGRQAYVTGDTSRNNWLLALLTMGEGWHNNHHAYQASVRQGFRWWQVDPTFYVLWLASRIGIVRNLKAPPPEVIRNERRPSARALDRAAAQLAAQFHVRPKAAEHGGAHQSTATSAAGAPPDCPEARQPTALLETPSLEALRDAARALFSENRWLEAVVEQAHERLRASVQWQLGRLSHAETPMF
jgi:stearoyl-CoA desaturase (Delta-9 desaturase)